MPDLFHGNTPSRGIHNHSGGAYDQSSMQDEADGDSLQQGITALTGVADALANHIAGNYVIKTAAADLMTLGAPTPGADDGMSINIWSDSTFVHTLTGSGAIFANGAALATVVTFKAFKGSGLTLRAFNGVWQVLASNVTSIA